MSFQFSSRVVVHISSKKKTTLEVTDDLGLTRQVIIFRAPYPPGFCRYFHVACQTSLFFPLPLPSTCSCCCREEAGFN